MHRKIPRFQDAHLGPEIIRKNKFHIIIILSINIVKHMLYNIYFSSM